ncbi:Variant SH3 domain family protein [Leishmania donovani]|uniref:Variant SH3 domain family protein n=2 Tax=Leishmania donovani TaxID=5661 RepID=A0A504XA45_LEIDO|nr:Variant SH3 domain family protein [Leishmania donovani]
MGLLRQVLDPNRRCVDLSDQRGGLTAGVLESLRTFLRYNDRYVHLCVSDNVLGSAAIAGLCALIKRHPHLIALEAQHCGLLDKDFRFYVGPAILTMRHLTFVDLSRNCGLTDVSAETLARILVETDVETVRLFGTSLTECGGRVIATAAANTTTLVSCELPFTVGSAVLEDIEVCTRRNRAHRAILNNASAHYTRLQVRRSRLPCPPALKHMEANPMVAIDELLSLESKPGAPPRSPTLLPPSLSSSVPSAQVPSSFAAASVANTKVASTAVTRRGKVTPDSLDEVTMWDWADPAMSTTLHCLYLLDRQAQLAPNRANSVVAMRYFVVAHEFQAEEDVELSVFKGEILCATEGIAQDGWIKVEVTMDARRRGFVPISYLREISAAEASASMPAPASSAPPSAGESTSPMRTPQRAGGESPARAALANTTISTSLNLGNCSDVVKKGSSPSLQPMRSPETAAAHAAPTSSSIHLTPAQQAAGPVNRHLLENPNAVVDAFMKNEVYFNQLMQRRASALAQMQSGLEEAMTEVAACKDRSAVLTRKLHDLDGVVERERQRWMDRVEEEKAHVSRSAPYSAPLAVPVSCGTTPVRSPIIGPRSGLGRSVLDDDSPRQLRA